MQICILGTGYVGLVTGACLADAGNNVWCVDIDEEKVRSLKCAVSPIYEPGLQDLLDKNISEGRLHFTTDINKGIEQALFCFICVGTPPSTDGSADLSYVFEAARAIGQSMNQHIIVIDKSTVPVGTADKVKEIIKCELKLRGREDIAVDVVSNPEFLKEGSAVRDFLEPDRIVIGADKAETIELMKKLYEPFVRSASTILTMDIKSAEITKYAANAMLATRISFMNEIAQLCDKVGGDIEHIRWGMGTDGRIGSKFLSAGAGYGGSCFPKDVLELINTGDKHALKMAIARAVHMVNEEQKHYLVEIIKKRFGEGLNGLAFGIWGLAFKPHTDDMRESPAIVIIKALLNLGANIIAHDPKALMQAKRIFENYRGITYTQDILETVSDVDAVVLITDWPEYRQLDFIKLKEYMRHNIIFDGRNQFQPEQMKSLGFEYYCIGRS